MINLLIAVSILQAQLLKKITDRVKSKVDKKVENKADKSVDAAMGGSTNSSTDNSSSTAANSGGGSQAGPSSLKTYSKYDFVPGEKIIVFEDFIQDAVGDLPAKWNTNTAAETVTIEGKAGHWMKMTKGVYMPDFITSLPEDFTLEFDLLVDKPAHSWGISPVLAEIKDRDKLDNWREADNFLAVNLIPGEGGNGSSYYEKKKMGSLDQAPTATMNAFADLNRPVHVAMWRQKERLRIYLNENKAWDVPKAISPEAKFNAFIISIQLTDDWHFFVSNIRLAVGAPDTRNKILKENKWVTHGILFDVNSATIKPESSGSLKEIATVLKENPDLKIKIVGHTDSDGKDEDNLDLSKRRAAAVKEALSKDFSIDAARMQTDGKGESEPIDKNDTPAGKANNRRVEFIKM